MQIVKVIVFSLTALMSHLSCTGQKQITGTFERTASIATEGRGIVYFFNNRNEFEKMEFMHLGGKKKYKGVYYINSDTLILNYKAYNIVLPKYEITRSQPIKGPLGSNEKKIIKAFFSKIRVINQEGQPLAGVNLILRNKEKQVIMGFSSNEKGLFPELSINDEYIHEFVFSFLGFHDEFIKTKILLGTITEITLTLSSGVEYSSFEGTKKYLIKNKSDDKIILSSIDEKETIILEKKTN